MGTPVVDLCTCGGTPALLARVESNPTLQLSPVYEIHSDLPRMNRDNVQIDSADGTVTVSDECRDERKGDYLSALPPQFRVPDSVAPERISAPFHDGLRRIQRMRLLRSKEN